MVFHPKLIKMDGQSFQFSVKKKQLEGKSIRSEIVKLEDFSFQ